MSKLREKLLELCQFKLDEQRQAFEKDLAECYRLSGADPDGDEDCKLAPHAVTEVKRMREEFDTAQAENEELQSKYDAAYGIIRGLEKENAELRLAIQTNNEYLVTTEDGWEARCNALEAKLAAAEEKP
jgi:hypothetical protein